MCSWYELFFVSIRAVIGIEGGLDWRADAPFLDRRRHDLEALAETIDARTLRPRPISKRRDVGMLAGQGLGAARSHRSRRTAPQRHRFLHPCHRSRMPFRHGPYPAANRRCRRPAASRKKAEYSHWTASRPAITPAAAAAPKLAHRGNGSSGCRFEETEKPRAMVALAPIS